MSFGCASGTAFGQDAAGEQPAPAAAGENEVARALRTAGFPEAESKVKPQTIINKLLTGMQKRLLKVDELINKMSVIDNSDLVKKTLFFTK